MDADRTFQPTGHASMDAEHEAIGLIIVRLLEAIGGDRLPDAQAVAAEVILALKAHFAKEEQLMEEVVFPFRDQHVEAHELYLEDVEKQLARLGVEGITPDLRRWAAGRMISWFRLHITTHDVNLGHFLQGRWRR
jgi:hemerythrin-like metal-binding protein